MKEALTNRRGALFRDEETKTNADREMIDSLLHGNLELTVPLAQEIYYKIKYMILSFNPCWDWTFWIV